MIDQIIKQIEDSKGRSEHIIVVVCDIRDFTKFCYRKDSASIADYIKTFYLTLLKKYFKEASFIKLTGDGMLIIYTCKNKKNIRQVSKKVVSSCQKFVDRFARIADKDIKINFKCPDRIGFGIARGTACCLHTNRRIVDYSGEILNLATRLNGLARPKGIVIDSAFNKELIPVNLKNSYFNRNVEIRGLLDEKPRTVFVSKDVIVDVRDPMLEAVKKNKSDIIKFKAGELINISSQHIELRTSEMPTSLTNIKIYFCYGTGPSGGYMWNRCYKYEKERSDSCMIYQVNLSEVKTLILENDIATGSEVWFKITYRVG